MTWNPTNHQGDESSKVRWELVPYMHGRALDLGAGPYKVFPHFISVDSCKDTALFGIRMKPDVQCDATKLDLFASDSCDCVFSSHLLEHVPYENVPATLREWMRVVKPGGHLILYLPDADQYPRIGDRPAWRDWYSEKQHEFPSMDVAVEAYIAPRRAAGIINPAQLYAGTYYANPDHKWDCTYEKIVDAMEQLVCGWDMTDYQVRSERDEYSLFIVLRKTADSAHEFSWKKPKPAKTCAIIRYGAIGDAIMVSSICPWLHEQNYHITWYTQDGPGYEAVKHDPHVDRFIVQGKDEVPNQFLGEFWDYTRKKYDKWINLSESIECTLLASPGRIAFEWPNSVRAKYLDRNYQEWTHELAEVPPPYRPKFYSTPKEREKARWMARKWGRRNLLWSLSGSSGHKTWPHLDMMIARIMTDCPDVHVVLVGDDFCKILEAGWEKEPRVHCQSGKWTIRESMAFAEAADLIIGTETGLLNAAGSMDIWKIITLSHSSPEMLTKHWKNVIVLQQPRGVGCTKSPCRQLHGGNNTDTWMDCPKHEETGTALCQFHVDPEMMWNAITRILGAAQRMVA